MVVVFHLFGHGRVSGGVDVFLTVSGFLLTLSLGRAIARGQPLGVLARWGRTFARLAPPAAIVLLAVTAATVTVLSPWARSQNLGEVVATALYFENWQLMATQLEYGAAGPDTSPLQHFWSLSVQAQFFIVFPLVTAVVTRLVKRQSAKATVFWGLVAAGTIASFFYAWHANTLNPQAAYFNSFARFWELGVGGLAAGLLLADRGLPRAMRPWGGWIGLAMIISSGFIFDGGSAYPGPAALVPVTGAIFVLLSASGGTASPTPILSSRPLVYLDKISYGLYLWHWPVLIVYFTIRQRDVIGWRGACLVLGIATVLTLVTRWVLQPGTMWAISSSLKRNVAFVAVTIFIAATPAGAMVAFSTAQTETQIEADKCAGAAALDPELPECDKPASFEQVVPGLEALRSDDGNRAECWTSGADATFRVCTLGPDEYSRHLVAVGDSHNNQWVEAYARIAENEGWRIDVAGRGACGWSQAERVQESVELTEACASWKSDVDDYLHTQAHLDGVIVAESAGARYESAEARVDGYVAAWTSREDVPVLAMRDNSMFEPSIMNCITNKQYVEDGACMVPRDVGLRDNGFQAAIDEAPNAQMIDITSFMCTDERCPMVIGNVIVSRDGSHLTETFTQTLIPYLSRAIGEALD